MRQKIKAKVSKKRFLGGVILTLLSVVLPAQQALAAGPVKIKWVKTCGRFDWNHGAWVVGLSDGNTVWGVFNPNQGRSATYSMILSAYMADKNIYFENAKSNTASVCGMVPTYELDPNWQNTANLMVGDP